MLFRRIGEGHPEERDDGTHPHHYRAGDRGCWAALAVAIASRLGRLPGDINIKGESGSLYIPITTSILVSLALSVLLWLFSR
jgi:hypothetical protein